MAGGAVGRTQAERETERQRQRERDRETETETETETERGVRKEDVKNDDHSASRENNRCKRLGREQEIF
eukprot:768753-Hanusia_phi.AAC.5